MVGEDVELVGLDPLVAEHHGESARERPRVVGVLARRDPEALDEGQPPEALGLQVGARPVAVEQDEQHRGDDDAEAEDPVADADLGDELTGDEDAQRAADRRADAGERGGRRAVVHGDPVGDDGRQRTLEGVEQHLREDPHHRDPEHAGGDLQDDRQHTAGDAADEQPRRAPPEPRTGPVRERPDQGLGEQREERRRRRHDREVRDLVRLVELGHLLGQQDDDDGAVRGDQEEVAEQQGDHQACTGRTLHRMVRLGQRALVGDE